LAACGWVLGCQAYQLPCQILRNGASLSVLLLSGVIYNA
jgi:hypothetical protein